MRFRHRLEGLERDWVEDGTRRTVNYSYIPPGQYRFQVLACNNDGVWNETGAALALTVVPFVWQTGWFKAVAALALFGAIGGAIRYVERRKLQRKVARLEQQRAVEHERARIAQDMHDDLGSRLTQITLMSELAQDELEHPAEAGEYLRRIESSARSLTRAMDEIVWAVNPRNDSLEGLLRYLQRFAQEHLTLAGVRCRWEVPVQVPALALPGNVRHSLYLACKEALHNVTKHAAATEARVHLEQGEASFTLIIEDNGRGFAASGGGPGNGLVNLQKRMADLGGRFEVESGTGAGARVRFVVPRRDQG